MNPLLQIASKVNWRTGQKPGLFFFFALHEFLPPLCLSALSVCDVECVHVQNKNGIASGKFFFFFKRKTTKNNSELLKIILLL